MLKPNSYFNLSSHNFHLVFRFVLLTTSIAYTHRERERERETETEWEINNNWLMNVLLLCKQVLGKNPRKK